MENRDKNKWQVRLAVLSVFVIGFIAGALAMNIYRGRQWSPSSADRRGRFEQIVDQLNLTPDQRAQVKVIFDDARAQVMDLRKQSEPKFKEVRERTDEHLKTVLTPEQWEQFQQLMNEARQRRHHSRDARGGRP